MNYTDLQERCWTFLGCHDTANKLDWRRQQIRDAINTAMDKVMASCPVTWGLVRESTLAIVAGTDVYTLDDWCKRPLFFWTEDSCAHKVKFNNYRNTVRDGSRNPNYAGSANGPWDIVWYPRTTAALKSGAAASATEAATSVTGLTGMAATDIGKMLHLKGQGMDHKISAVPDAISATVDRAIKSRLTGLGTSGTGSGYSSVKWEVSPPGRYRIKVLPDPTVASTMYYSFMALHRKLMLDDDVPELPEEHHHLLWKGALDELAAFNEDDPSHQRYKGEWLEALAEFNAQDRDDMDDSEPAHYESLLTMDQNTKYMPNDVSRRGN